MKNLAKVMFIILMALVVSSCEKEEEFTLVGTWNLDKADWKLYNQNDNLEVHEVFTNIGKMKFESSGSGSLIKTGKTPEPFTWSLSGESLTITGVYFIGMEPSVLIYAIKNKELKKFTLENSSPVASATYTQVTVINCSKI